MRENSFGSKSVTGAGEEYTVVFTVNNKDIDSRWIREYGNWQIRSFGTVATGDKSLLAKKEAKKKTAKKLRTNSVFHIETGYANLFDRIPGPSAFPLLSTDRSESKQPSPMYSASF